MAEQTTVQTPWKYFSKKIDILFDTLTFWDYIPIHGQETYLADSFKDLNYRRNKTMFNTQLKSSLVALSIASVLSACGGSGGGTNPSSTDVTSSGTISGFGSVIVNGTHFDTTGARVVRDDGSIIDDSPSNDELKAIVGEGNIVKVRGTSNGDGTGTADTITVDDELVGDITANSINDTDVTFEVNGQTISVSPDTIIDDSIIGNSATDDAAFGTLNTPLSTLLAGVTTVEISGFPTQNGLEATRIEDVDTSTTARTDGPQLDDEIKGFIENLDTPVANQFQINGLTIDYGSLTTPLGFTLADGQLVEVHGDINGTLLTATTIELEDDLLDDDFDEGEVEIEGIIQSITPTTGTAGIIVINTVEIPVDDISQFSVGMHVEIKAVLQNGSLQVIRVHDEGEDTVRTEDMVASVANGVITTRLGIEIEPGERSRLEDDSETLGEDPSIAEFLGIIDSSTHIEARGFPLDTGVLWTRVEISNDAEARCRLRGPVADIDATSSTFTIQGVTIDASGNTEFEDANDILISRDAFFNSLEQNPDAIVQATSRDASGCNHLSLTAKQVEFEPADDVIVDDGGNGGNNVNDNELTGAISNITANSLDIAGETVTVNDATLIDDSIIEKFRGVELPADLPFGDLTETLAQLLVDDAYQVQVDRSNGVVATSIEDL